MGASYVALVVKNPLANAGDIRDAGSSSGSGRAPGGGHSNPLQHTCLENPLDRGACGSQSMGLQRVRHNKTCTKLRLMLDYTHRVQF